MLARMLTCLSPDYVTEITPGALLLCDVSLQGVHEESVRRVILEEKVECKSLVQHRKGRH